MSYRFIVYGLCFFGICLSLAANSTLDASELQAKLSDDGKRVTVTVDGKLFAEYLTCSGVKPIIWPIIGPTGKRMTREYPMAKKAEYERDDHIHQRSMWFTHGNVNGINFWAESKRGKNMKENAGEIKHREFVKIESGKTATIVVRNDWCKMADGTKICEEETKITFGANDDNRWIDYDITLKACDKPVTLGDDKEGCFGIRMAAPLKPDAKLGGILINSNGQKNSDAWGKSADWVDYSGKLGGDKVGISMMNHPSSFRYPTHWHARTYGLCSANPFGLSFFEEGSGKNGAYTIPVGGSIKLSYRVLFHKGDVKEAKVDEAFKAYAKTTR
ncbi:MAG: PmoA family protein [Pirellulales bacterium]|nr:PmoA family protein [Pirellulales bacterium]